MPPSPETLLRFPQCHSSDPSYGAWIDIAGHSVTDHPVKGFEWGDLRYTPITVQQANLLWHENIDYEEEGIQYPTFLEDMFNSDHYNRFLGGETAPFRVRFVETPDRRVNVLIGVTMYQERCGGLDDVKFDSSIETWESEDYEDASYKIGTVPATFLGVLQNLKIFNRQTRFTWDNVVICLLSDGRTKINLRDNNLGALQKMGMYYDLEKLYKPGGMMEARHRVYERDRDRFLTVSDKDTTRTNPRFTVDDGMPVFVHLFENIVKYKDHVPIQFMFVLKEFNAGKLDTHLWFFECFAHYFYRLQKKEVYCVCLDAGTKPSPMAIVELIERMEADPDVAGVSGQIVVENPLCQKNLFNCTVASQTFEYKVGNFMDKAFEAFFGCISVLPGAFSAYRWSALSPPQEGPYSVARPITPYFMSCTSGGKLNPFYGNMYLAEDRVLCNALICSPGARNMLSYVPSAFAETDVPSNMITLMKQRRRWLNGAFFASLHTVWNGLFLGKICKANHSFLRTFGLSLEYFYYAVHALMVWFLCGFFYFLFVAIWTTSLDKLIAIFVGDDHETEYSYTSIVHWIVAVFLAVILCIMAGLSIFSSPDSKTKGVRTAILTCNYILMAFMFMTVAMVWIMVSFQGNKILLALGLVVALAPIILSVFHLEIQYILPTVLQAWVMAPVYVMSFQIYAFCNTDDLSWGTKGLDTMDQEQIEASRERRRFRNIFLGCWLGTNITMGVLTLFYVPKMEMSIHVNGREEEVNVLIILFAFAAVTTLLRMFGSIMFLIGPQFQRSREAKKHRRNEGQGRQKRLDDLRETAFRRAIGESTDGATFLDPSYSEMGLCGMIPRQRDCSLRIMEPDDNGSVIFSEYDESDDEDPAMKIPDVMPTQTAIAEILKYSVSGLPNHEQGPAVQMILAQSLMLNSIVPVDAPITYDHLDATCSLAQDSETQSASASLTKQVSSFASFARSGSSRV